MKLLMMKFKGLMLIGLLLPTIALAQLDQRPPPTPPGWTVGGIDAINNETRSIVINEQKYRVALKASFKDIDGSKMSFEDLDIMYAIEFELEPKTGDVLNIKVVAYP